MNRPRRIHLQPGDRFHRWTVLEPAPDQVSPSGKRRPRYLCRCDCGTLQANLMQNLKNGQTQSCGCILTDRPSGLKHGDSKTVLYRRWAAMRGRCQAPGHPDYPRYGGRGIAVCPEWQDWPSFKKWAEETGYAPGLELDRIDNDGPYCPENCQWVTRTRQCRNTSRTVVLTAYGETKALSDWAEDPRCTVGAGTLNARLRYGWSLEDALTLPLSRGKKNIPHLAA